MSDMQDSLRELYQEVIFDHNRNPRNYRPLPAASHHADGHNRPTTRGLPALGPI